MTGFFGSSRVAARFRPEAQGRLWPISGLMSSDIGSPLSYVKLNTKAIRHPSRRYFFVFKQFCNIYAQSHGEPLQPINGNIGNAAFKLRHVGSMKIRQFSHPLLA